MEHETAAGDPAETILRYHDRTKHGFHRFARSLGYMDWANEPDPFRRYEGAALQRLPRPSADRTPPYDLLFSPGAVPARPVDRASISDLLYDSLSISAWKTFGGSTWALRVNPSSGNLHPTEAYLALPAIDGIGGAAVWHYAPKEHGLERRGALGEDAWKELRAGFPDESFFAAFTSIHWREAWKYGERAYRYCQHDAGHAVAALRFAAAALGWEVRVLGGVTDDDVAAITGVDRADDFRDAEREHPDLVAAIVPAGGAGTLPDRIETGGVRAARRAAWTGRANRLSAERAGWRVIDIAAEAGRKTSPGAAFDADDAPPAGTVRPIATASRPVTAREIVRRRRSAMAMDGRTTIGLDAFVRMLARTVPALSPVPWDALAHGPRVHLGIFVHLVDGLEPGLYLLVRNAAHEGELRAAMRKDFLFTRPPGVPDDLPLSFLARHDLRALAATVSCRQEIAGAGAFSLGMIARFEETIRRGGAAAYPRLFRETGMIGQTLYLEAEAAGLRGTGIGCYFDDPVHEIFGLEGRAFQSLYHFTVGGAVDDPRLTTLPPYPDEGEGGGAPVEPV